MTIKLPQFRRLDQTQQYQKKLVLRMLTLTNTSTNTLTNTVMNIFTKALMNTLIITVTLPAATAAA